MKLKVIFERINKNKEDLKSEIQKVTKLRNALNDAEDELLLKEENYYEILFFNEETIKECIKLPNKINSSLEEGKKSIRKKIISIINDYINIENRIKDINIISRKIEECKKNDDIKFNINPEEEDINKEKFKNVGRLFDFDS